MQSRLLLSCVLGAVGMIGGAWLTGCANGSPVTGQPSGAGGDGGSGGADTGGAATSSASSSSAASSTSGTTGSTGGTGATGGGGGMPGLQLGDDCNVDADCESNLCKPVVIGVGPVCVTPCTQQSDCGGSANYFCDPITAGSPDGYCVPHSPSHCLSCAVDADCGSLSEVCFLAPGDIQEACHVDCAISGENACPPEYTCTDQTVNGVARKLCRPNIPTCLDAIGGYCDRLVIPQPCTRTNPAGTCLGQRECIPGTKRFDKCGAMAPQCKADCSLQDPAGCTLVYCAGATTGPDNCGSCGNICPGYMKPNDNVACNGGNTCTFSCQGEFYDVDDQTNTGCEVVDSPTGNHTQNGATSVGSISCNDGNGMTVQISGKLVSDKQAHATPAVTGFDAASGSAPDWYNIDATGGICEDDINLTLQMTGSVYGNCYKMIVTTTNGTYTCQTAANGSCTISKPSGSYQDDTTILIEVQKTCNTTKIESVNYTVKGHL